MPVYELGEYEGSYFLVMKYMPGGSLKELITSEGRLPFERALEITRQISEALDFSHNQPKQLIHRDVKPGNVLFEESGNARLSDFGFAKAITGTRSASLSASGGMIGTPPYMAPEVWRGQDVTPATDIYSLACVFYEMLTGEVLFDGESPPEIMTRHVLDRPQLPDNWFADTPKALTEVLTKALAMKVKDRYFSLERFQVALSDLETPAQEQARLEAEAGVFQEEERMRLEAAEEEANRIAAEEAASREAEQPTKQEVEEKAKRERELQEEKRKQNEVPEIESITTLESPQDEIKKQKTTYQTAPKKKVTQTSWWKHPAAWGGGIGLMLLGLFLVTVVLNAVSKPNSEPVALENITTSTNTPELVVIENKVTSTKTLEPDGISEQILDSGSAQISNIDNMVLIPPGPFAMGNENSKNNEQPIHIVTLDGYYIDQFEVTNANYKVCVNEGACALPIKTSVNFENYFDDTKYVDYPVVYVSWNDANTYCNWRGARLPTEAEWEKAARGPDERTYPWGEATDFCNRANFRDCVVFPVAVGSYPDGTSPYGVLDMAGNVWEWVADWYDQDYYEYSPSINPKGPTNGEYKIYRGGSWWIYTEPTSRMYYGPSVSNWDLGFRCARSATP